MTAIKELVDADGNPAIKNFKGWGTEKIVEYVLRWFHHLYSDPADEMPHVDGEYLFIWGGPYEPRAVIEDAFGDRLPEKALEEVVSRITSDGGYQWAPSSNHPDQLEVAREHAEQDEYEVWLSENDPETIFKTAMGELENFVANNLPKRGGAFLHRMAFMQAWAILESYLAAKITKAAHHDDRVVRRLYDGHDTLKSRKFSGADLLKTPDLPKREAIKFLGDELYHNLPRVLPLYGVAFGQFKDAGVDFAPAMKALSPLILKRHDCVHRNGKTKDDEKVGITPDDVSTVLTNGLALVVEIEKLVKYNWFDDLGPEEEG